tara:strand:- start:746 stop:1294 length:549 start_codon:yes stop_codon:yes gene_type:complete
MSRIRKIENGETVKVAIREYDPVVDSTGGKVSAVSLIPYNHTRGLVKRSSGKEILLGYCLEPPKRVFNTLFEGYSITRFNSYDLFDQKDLAPETPMLGLGIAPVEPPTIYGITYDGRLAGLLENEEFIKATRTSTLSDEEIEKITEHVCKMGQHAVLNSNFEQVKRDKKEILDLVSGFIQQP